MQNLLSLIVDVSANITGLQNGLNQGNGLVNNFGQNAANAGNAASQSMATSGIAIAASIAAAVGLAIGAITKVSDEAYKLQNQLQASLGQTTEQAKALTDVAVSVWADNFGESITEVGAAVQQVSAEIKGLNDVDLKGAVENAYRLKDVYGVETAESIKTAKTLMSEFGLSQQQAFDFIAKGMQSGLNASDDFLDTIGEYSNQFKGMGLDAGQFFSVLQTGLKGGVLGTDKIADSFKEFGIRIIDGSKTTSAGLAQIGLSANKLSADLSTGKMTKGEAFTLIQQKLRGVKDQLVQNQAGVALFGTQWEDLGGKAILSVNTQKTGLKDLQGATAGLDVKYNDIGNAMEGLKRKALVAFRPIGDAMVSLINTALPFINSFIAILADIGNGFNALPDPIKNFITFLAVATATVAAGITAWGLAGPAIKGIGASFTATGAVVRTAAASIGASISAAIWPITLVVAAVVGLYIAYRTNFLGIRDFLQPIIKNIVAWFYKIVDGIKFVVYNSSTLWKSFLTGMGILGTGVKGVVSGINTILGGVGLILYSAFVEPFVPILQALNTAGNAIGKGLQTLVNNIISIMSPVFDALKAIGADVGAVLQGAVNKVGSFVTNIFGNAANDIKANAEVMAKQNTTAGKGLDQIKKGWNEITSSVKTTEGSIISLAKTTQSQLKTPPKVIVPNAGTPVFATTKIPAPINTKYNGADSAAAKKTKAPKAKKVAKPKVTKPKVASQADISGISKEITRMLEDQKRLVASGKITEEQAISYTRKVEDLADKIKSLNAEHNKTIAPLMIQAVAYESVSNAAAKSAAKRAADAATKKKEEEAETKRKQVLAAEVGKLKSAVENMSDVEIASTIKRLEASKSYGYKKKEEVLLAEQHSRNLKLEAEANENLIKTMEDYLATAREIDATAKDFEDTDKSTNLETAKLALNTQMEEELAAAGDNETAKFEIKKKFAASIAGLEEASINADKQKKLADLKEKYDAQMENAKKLGNDTSALTSNYNDLRKTIDNNATAQIASVRSKSAIDIANDQISLDKQITENRIQVNKEASAAILDAITQDMDTSSLASLQGTKELLTSLLPQFADNTEGLADLGLAIKNVDKEIKKFSDDAAKGLKDVIDSTSDLGEDFDKVTQSEPSARDKFINDGLSGFDALIKKYDEALKKLAAIRQTLLDAGNTAGVALVDTVSAGITDTKTEVVGAKGVKATQLGAKFDTTALKEFNEYNTASAAKQLSLATDLSKFKTSSLESEKAGKLALAGTDEDRARVELDYVGRIQASKIEAAGQELAASTRALEVERDAANSKEGLTQAQQDANSAYYNGRIDLAKKSTALEIEGYNQAAAASEKANKKILDGWKTALLDFLKSAVDAIGTAYTTVYTNNKKLAETAFTTPEEKAKAESDNKSANADASKNLGTGLVTAGASFLSTMFPEFKVFIDMFAGLLTKMPQLGIIFQRVGEVFLNVFSLLEPVIDLLATVLEPLLNIMTVMLDAVIKPLLPVLTFFVKVTSAIITAVYNVIKTVWNAIAGFLNGINILGWKPFNLTLLPELDTGSKTAINTPSAPSGGTTQSSSDSNNSSSQKSTQTSTTNVTIYVNEASDPNKVAALVEKRIIKAMQ